MSLLLDALKRAEQEKLARQGEASNDAASGNASAAAPAGKPAPTLELQPLGGAAPAGSAGARAQEASHAAQVMFDAKSASAAADKPNKGVLWATLGVIAMVVASAGAYVWYQIRLLSPGPVPVVARRLPPLPLPQPASGSPPPTTAFADSRGTPATVTAAPEPAPAPPSRLAVFAPPAQRPAAPEDPVARLLRDAPRADAAPPLKLDRSPPRPPIPRDVSEGYAALRAGDLAEARRRYEAALAADPASLDARLGMATVEARAGRGTLARAQYRRVLQMDPRNATALAGLAALADSASPEAVEAQLREDVARFPDSVPLLFALGSHYAGQRRWGEAQAAFFEAYRLDPTGADILYNLAVSLDHMNQTRLAADFYRRAVEASQAQTTQFDPAPARRRLAEITAR